MMNDNITKYRSDFESVYNIILAHRNRVVQRVNSESIMMVWEAGCFVSSRIKTSKWGSGVVRQLAEYIHTQDPTVRGWSYRTIYKMVQFYETYSTPDFANLLSKAKPHLSQLGLARDAGYTIVPIQSAQSPSGSNMPIESAQIPEILFATGWGSEKASCYARRPI